MYPTVPHAKSGGLFALTYVSELGPALQDPLRLAEIVARIRPTNSGLSVTGAILCDAGHIQQWIEGPESAIALLWDRIRLDPRHRVHWATPPAMVTARQFPGSPMKLALTTANLARLDPYLTEDVVMLQGGRAPSAPSFWADTRDLRFPDGFAGTALRHLDPAHRAATFGLTNARAAALADALTNSDPLAARQDLDGILWRIGVPETATLVHAVLDHVQANWMAGLISAWQRQLAMTMLQSALRLRLDVAESPNTIGSTLVGILPGTPDMCGAMLKVALLRGAGWSVRLLLAQSIEEIRLMAQSLQPDLIVLAGSRLSARPAEIAMLTDLLPALAVRGAAPVIVGGKLAETEPQMLLRRGASAVCGALSWITTIAAHLAPPPAPSDLLQAKGQAVPADHALATFLAATRARDARI